AIPEAAGLQTRRRQHLVLDELRQPGIDLQSGTINSVSHLKPLRNCAAPMTSARRIWWKRPGKDGSAYGRCASTRQQRRAPPRGYHRLSNRRTVTQALTSPPRRIPALARTLPDKV